MSFLSEMVDNIYDWAEIDETVYQDDKQINQFWVDVDVTASGPYDGIPLYVAFTLDEMMRFDNGVMFEVKRRITCLLVEETSICEACIKVFNEQIDLSRASNS